MSKAPASGHGADSPQKESSDLAGQMAERRRTIETLRAEGINPYDNDAPITHQIYELPAQAHEDVLALPGEAEIQADAPRFAIAGRLLQVNDMGKAKFLFLRGDRGQMVQLYLKADEADAFAVAKRLDLGDFVWARGPLFKTRKEKRALRIEKGGLRLLSKAIRPLPGKALQEGDKALDDDWRYRQRYADMIIRPEVADVFRKRAQIVTGIRSFFDARGYVEADTRVLQNTNGGAAARPFATHMNALNIDLFLRIATELDLKRLVVGGLERVYEIGRLFRNEGLSRFHNPEFTTIEFYQAYATYRDIMDLVEALFETLALTVHKTTTIDFQELKGISLKRPFRRGSMRALVKAARPDAPITATMEQGENESPCGDDEWNQLPAYAKSVLPEGVACKTYGHALVSLFEHFVEGTLIQPTFVTLLPTEISPLARKNDKDPRFVDRFELFVAGREFANAFSELNDPDDQRARFVEQVDKKAGGDHEAMDYDEDYCRALEYGLPPTAGCGIGIDRLCMLLTNQASIRDVIPFPILRPESHQGHENGHGEGHGTGHAHAGKDAKAKG